MLVRVCTCTVLTIPHQWHLTPLWLRKGHRSHLESHRSCGSTTSTYHAPVISADKDPSSTESSTSATAFLFDDLKGRGPVYNSGPRHVQLVPRVIGPVDWVSIDRTVWSGASQCVCQPL